MSEEGMSNEKTVHVVNGRTSHGVGVWVDRRSPLGNPFRMTSYARNDAVIRYEAWLCEELVANPAGRAAAMFADLERLAARPQGVTLVCWCHPQRCHAHVIQSLIQEMP
jgi:hypothetical protein